MTPQPNEPTADIEVILQWVDSLAATNPAIPILTRAVRGLAALRAENERLIKAHGLVWNAVRKAAAAFRWLAIPEQAHGELREDAERIFAAEKCKPDWSTDWEIVSRTELTQLRASLSTAVDAFEKANKAMETAELALTWSAPKGGPCCAGEVSTEEAEAMHEEAHELLGDAIDQLRPLLAGKPPAAEVKADGIIDAAIEVAAFSKSHSYPAEGSPEFFEFATKLDRLATAIGAHYPSFNKVQSSSAQAEKAEDKKR